MFKKTKAAGLHAPLSPKINQEDEAMSKWRHIKSAPKDGTSILLAEVSPDWSNVMEGRWCTPYFHSDINAPKPMPGWWGLNMRGGYSGWSGGPYGRAEMVAIMPRYWKPMDTAPKYRKQRDYIEEQTP